jgi:glucose dehydrogenase
MLRTRALNTAAAIAAVVCLHACAQSGTPQAAPEPHVSKPAAVDDARIRNADREPGNWMSYNRTYDEQRYSPLAGIDTSNVKRLGLAWYIDLDAAARAQESTPLVIDGVMYVTTAWSKVLALDAASGRRIWSYDPEVPGRVAVNACCDVVNRGVAAWKGRLYLGTLDGRLVALDAATGAKVWEVMTVDPGGRYRISVAPRVVND